MRTTGAAALLIVLTLSHRIAAAQDPPPLPPGSEPAPAAPEAPAPTAPPPAEPVAAPPTPSVRTAVIPADGAAVTTGENFIARISVRESSQNTVLLPKGAIEIGGEMTFLTSSLAPEGGDSLDFTDVGLLMLNARYSFGPVEIAATTDFLVKQPSFMDEWVPQSGSLTTRVALGLQQALAIQFEGGPLLRDLGIWESAQLSIQAKRDVHRTIVFEGALGGNFTHINFDRATQREFWFSEVVVGLKTILRTPFPAFAAWVTADLAIPVAGSPDRDSPDPSGFLDPQTRLNFSVGAAYLLAEQWNLYASLAVIDRGDEENPESMLPILRGGFDQQHLTFGVQYRWELGSKLQVAE
jgi:hypothetical protein